MSKAPSMPMFWDAYLADTTHLTTEEHGAYMLLLAAMWRRNGWVPDNDKDNARILGLSTAKWKRTKERLSSFLIFENDSISQQKLLGIWQKTQENIEKNRSNGAKGGRPKSNENNRLGKPNGSNSDNPNKTIPEPEPEPERKKEPTAIAAGTDFQKGKTGKNWIWSEGVDHIIRTSDRNQHQARSTIGYLLKMCDEKPDRLMKFFIEALEQGSVNLEAAIKAKVGKRITAKAAGKDHAAVVPVSCADDRYKPLQDRHLAEMGKRKFQANGVSHFPAEWLAEMEKAQ